MKVVIAGGSGFMGRFLRDRFTQDGNEVYTLTRKPRLPNDVYWDGENVGVWTACLNGADLLINLAGKSVDCRYTPRNKSEILASRVQSTRVLAKAITLLDNPPSLWLNSSTATIYQHSLSVANDEEAGILGTGFSVSVAKAWEQTFFESNLENTRLIALRTAIVLGKDGGALLPISRLARYGLGGKQHTGKQMVSWVHQEDLYRAFLFLLNCKQTPSVINLAAPNPVTNSIFMSNVRKSLSIKFGLDQPKWLLEIGAWLIGTETELVLKSRFVVPKTLLDLGFQFKYEKIKEALDDLVK